MKDDIKREDYYENMYDIEHLTDLNRKGSRPKNETVIRIERLIRANRCARAKMKFRILFGGDQKGYFDARLKVLNGALWVKDHTFSDAVVHRFENLSPKNCALAELSRYLRKPAKEIAKKMLVGKPVAESWRKINPDPQSEKEIDNFYITTDAYIYELMAANNIVQTLYSYYVLSQKLNHLRLKTILDYGAGAGTLSILFQNLGYKVAYADLPGKLFNFAKWRFAKRKIDIPMLVLKKDRLQKKYDGIICTEVFEHVVKPEVLLKKLKARLKKGGILIVSESCEYTKDFLSHLESNKKYGGKNFIKLMKSFGFEQIMPDPFIPQMIFRKK